MSESCNQQCSSCSQECDERKEKTSFLVEPSESSSIKKVIGVVSGKGGVGKSIVTSMLATEMKKRGNHVAILDADITGPSIPKAFGLREKAHAIGTEIVPVKSQLGIDIMSLNLLVANDTDPVIWRGPIIAETVKKFWAEVIWKDVDYMFVDMPPGTGDVPLTVFQSLPLAGIVIVTSPQELVSMIVGKAVNMAKKMNVPILGVVENMSYFKCPDCGREISVFGESNIENTAREYNIDVFTRIPIDPQFAKACDNGKVEALDVPWLNKILIKLEKI